MTADPNIAFIIFGSLGITLLLGVPIGYALGIATAAALTFTPTPYIYIAQTLYTGTGLFALIAIPGFILAGELMVRSKLTDQIIRVMFVLAGNIKGGLAVCTFLSCAFFAALSGSGPATTAAIGSIMIPAMVRAGYPVAWSAAVVASGGTLGILIPPSNPMIVYAVSANVSVTGLFLAGLIPGILLVALFSVYSWVYGHMTGLGKSGEPFRMKAFLAALWEGKAAMVMPVLVLGVIYGGLATPTEAAMLAVLYASAAGIISRKLGMKQFIEAMITTGKLTGAVLIIMGPATAFGRLLTLYGVPDQIAQTFISISENPLLILLLVSLLLIVIGTFMESLSSIVLLTPILLPPLVQLGVDPVQFGVLFVVLSQVGMLTPPLGVNLFVASAVSRTSIEKISLAVLPLIGLLLVFAFVLIIFPSLSTFAYGLVAR
ncbi:TRAP transporter large permease subunit [Rhodobacterales bacterium FZCC0188]|nr:TRAP transporter large permease subunit [Rhodobacterales bacterium FZCC0188]